MYTVYPPMEDLRISSHASLEKKVEQLNLEKKLVHDWRRRWQTNPILKISDWIGLPWVDTLDCIGLPPSSPIMVEKVEHLHKVVKRGSWRCSMGGYNACRRRWSISRTSPLGEEAGTRSILVIMPWVDTPGCIHPWSISMSTV